MSVTRVIEKLESYIREGTWLPAGYRVLSEERLLEFVEKIRSTLPEEVSRAKTITRDQDLVLRAAQEKAETIVAQAATRHEELLDDHEILQRARTTAEVVLREAEERARKIRDGADSYALQVLGEMESRMGLALGSIRKGREALVASQRPPGAAATPALADAAARSKRAAFDLQSAEQTAEMESVSAI